MAVIAASNRINYQKIVPFWDEVVVKVRVKNPTAGGKTASGIYLPETVTSLTADDHASIIGEIVSIGPMAFSYQSGEGVTVHNVFIGDKVMFRPYSGDEFKDHDEEGYVFRMMPSRQITGKILED